MDNKFKKSTMEWILSKPQGYWDSVRTATVQDSSYSQLLDNLAGEDNDFDDLVWFMTSGNSSLIKKAMLCHEFYPNFDELLEQTMELVTFTKTDKHGEYRMEIEDDEESSSLVIRLYR